MNISFEIDYLLIFSKILCCPYQGNTSELRAWWGVHNKYILINTIDAFQNMHSTMHFSNIAFNILDHVKIEKII